MLVSYKYEYIWCIDWYWVGWEVEGLVAFDLLVVSERVKDFFFFLRRVQYVVEGSFVTKTRFWRMRLCYFLNRKELKKKILLIDLTYIELKICCRFEIWNIFFVFAVFSTLYDEGHWVEMLSCWCLT